MRAKRTAGLAFLVLLTACLLAACGRSGEATGSKEASGEHTIDLGGGRQVTVDKGAKANIAFFIATTSNLYTQAMVDEAEKTAAKLGAGLTVFDGKFDATTQYNQMQSALQRHEFNAWWVSPIDGNQSCSMLSETAPEQGIVVGISDIVLCDRGERPADEVWQPGTLDYVGAETTTNFIDAWVEQIAARLPGAHEIGVLEGPPLTNLTDNIEAALEELEKRRPDLHVVASENTDFTTPDGLAKAQTMLHAHPGIDVVISSYADVTVGAIKAIKAAGKPVQVFDLGGSAAEVPLIKDGSLTASAAYSPRGHARAVVTALVGAVLEGKKPPTFDPGLDYGSTDKPYMVEKSNVDTYRPQY